MEHLGSKARHLEHLVIGTPGHLAWILHDAGIRRIDAIHIGQDLTLPGSNTNGESHRAGIRSSTTEGRDLVLPRHSLETGNHHHPAAGEMSQDSLSLHLLNTRLHVGVIGNHPGLRTRQRDSSLALLFEGDRQQGCTDDLAGVQQHVHLTPRRLP